MTANLVSVHGIVFGSIQAREVKLKPSSNIEEDIYHEELEIEMGTNFSGKLTRTPFNAVVRLSEAQIEQS